ncbi:hypothetical protein [Staphylococcus caeli]
MKFGKYNIHQTYFVLSLSFLALSAAMPIFLAVCALFLALGIKKED